MTPGPGRSESIFKVGRWTPTPGRPRARCREEGESPVDDSRAVVVSMAQVPRRSELISTVGRWIQAPGRPRARCREEDESRLPVNEVRALTS